MVVPRAFVVEQPVRKPRVDVIVNRVARRLTDGAPVLQAIHAAVRAAPDRALLHETRSLEDLDAVVRDLATREPSCVILAGGDGSYMAGTTALSRVFGESLPSLAFAPGGTVSTVARNWGYRGSRAECATRLIESVLAGQAARTRRPTLRIRDDAAGSRVGFIFGAGLVAHFFDAYYDAGAEGYAAAAKIVARVFLGSFTGGDLARRILSPSACRLTLDGHAQERQAWSLIAASVVGDLGLHMRLLYRAAEDPSAFHTVASALPAHLLGPQLPLVIAGRRLRGRAHVDTLARELRLEFPNPATYVLDGDRIRARTVTVTPGPVLDFVAAPPR